MFRIVQITWSGDPDLSPNISPQKITPGSLNKTGTAQRNFIPLIFAVNRHGIR